MNKSIILYFAIAFILSIIGTYAHYRIWYSYKDIDDYFEFDFSVKWCLFFSSFWPLVLFILFFTAALPSFFKSIIKLLDKMGEKFTRPTEKTDTNVEIIDAMNSVIDHSRGTGLWQPGEED